MVRLRGDYGLLADPTRSKDSKHFGERKVGNRLQGARWSRQLESNLWIRHSLSKNILEKPGFPSAGLPKAGGWTM